MKRPIIIEFSGLPNSGKTTLLHNLDLLCKRDHLNALIVQEPAELIPSDIPKGSIAQNLWITLETLQRNIESIYKNNFDCILIDRGFYNQLFWATMYADKDPWYSNFIINFMRDFEKKYKVIPDYLYVVDVGISESIKRRAANGGTVTFSKKEFLNDYRIKFREFYENIKHRLYIDTTNLSESEVAFTVFEQLKKLL